MITKNMLTALKCFFDKKKCSIQGTNYIYILEYLIGQACTV